MAKVEVTVCDVCRDLERKALSFRVIGDEGSWTLELCKEHATPLRDLLRHGTIAPSEVTAITRTRATPKTAARKTVPTRRKRAGFDAAVATMEEIEASKRA